MRGVGRQVREERPVPIGFDEPHRAVEPDVGAVARVLLGLAVVPVGVVEVVVAPEVRRLADAAAAVDQDLLESAILRPEGVVVAEVPFAEDARAVAPRREDIRHRHLVAAEQRPAQDRVPDARAVAVAPGHQRGPRRRAGRAHVEIRQADALAMQRVDVRRAEDRIAVAAQVAVALVVGDHQNDVRRPAVLRRVEPSPTLRFGLTLPPSSSPPRCQAPGGIAFCAQGPFLRYWNPRDCRA